MSNMFSGLESLGFKNLKSVDLYEEEEKKEVSVVEEKKPQTTEADILFDKKYTCPCCDTEFISSITSKTNKLSFFNFIPGTRYTSITSTANDYSGHMS